MTAEKFATKDDTVDLVEPIIDQPAASKEADLSEYETLAEEPPVEDFVEDEALEASIVVDQPKEEDVLVSSVIGEEGKEQVIEEVYVEEAPEASHGNLRSDDFYVSDEM